MGSVNEALPGRYPVEMIGRYINLVSKYINTSHEVYRDREYEIKRRELERELWQTGKHLECIQMQTGELPSYYFIKHNRSMCKVDLGKTMCIYTYKRKVTFIQDDDSRYETYTKLDDIWKDIRIISPGFCRISSRYIVNFMYVNDFSSNDVHIGEHTLHIAPRYLQGVLDGQKNASGIAHK